MPRRASVTAKAGLSSRLSLAVTAALIAASTCTAGATHAAPGPARSPGPVHVAPVPTRGGVNFTIPAPDYPQFYDVSCATADSCLAVGSSSPTSDKYLAEQWNGSSWRQLPVPRRASADGFDAVSCPTVSECMALDSLGGSPELWNGSSWRAEPLSSTLTSLGDSAISCGSPTSCVLVGITPNAAVWDGTTWHASKTVNPPSDFPHDNELNSISCVSAADCVAVGSYEAPVPGSPGEFEPAPLAEAWDGKAWTQLPTASLPAGATLSSISCTGPASCVAVGNGFTPQDLLIGVAAAWNGATWTLLPDPMASLTSVSCMSAAGGSGGSPSRASTMCAALGTDPNPPGSPVAESWNGTSWTPMPLPSPLPYLPTLNALSCGGPSSCLAVGTAFVPGSLAMTWNGAKWRISRASKRDMLTRVSCTGVGRCVATGGYVGQLDAPLTLAEALTGNSWRATRLPGGRIGVLEDVSCDGTHGCVAVGPGGLALKHSLASRWDGRAWRQMPGPAGVVGGLGTATAAVSCVQADCLATEGILAQWWNGVRWRRAPVQFPKYFGDGGFAEVSCASTARCLAIGSYDLSYGDSLCCLAPGHHATADPALAEMWNGRAMRLLNPSGAGLSSISCVTTSFCMTITSNSAKPWTGRFRGDVRLPGYFGSPGLVAVSCASVVACMAVGYYVAKRAVHAVAVVWDGVSWRRIDLPTPRAYLADVSCPSATWCVAVGYAFQGQAATRTLAALWNGTRWQILKAASP